MITAYSARTTPHNLCLEFLAGFCPRYQALRSVHPQRQTFTDKRGKSAPSDLCAILNITRECTNGVLIDAVGEIGQIEKPFTLDDVWKIADTLFCRRAHQEELPLWATDHMVDYLYELSGWSMYQMFSGPVERRLTAGMLIKQIIQNANDRLAADSVDTNGVGCQKINGGSKRLVLYSAHDTTVAMLMMGLDQNHFGFEPQPPYASAILIELWTDSFLKGKFQPSPTT
jgi:hypothetical protein